MIRPSNDEFYIGYADRAPMGIARFVRRWVGILGAVGVGVALLGALTQQSFDDATFEFGQTREFQGHIEATPYPALLIPRPGTTDPALSVSRLHLVAPGKRGADDMIGAFDRQGGAVALSGTLIYRDDQTMIEVIPGSIAPSAPGDVGPATTQTMEDLGTVTLRGEVVDSKCFLGVMNPATWTPHRACAVRCVSGGIPPMLVVRDSAGVLAYVLLADARGRPNGKALLDVIAEPIEVTGRLERHNGQLFLFADRSSYRRI
ncbi:MAG: hypothetical protein HKM89_01190 [Gemmatimonadales bacterium]|nr:hypothetical protein [Gemmatimonadales bacterium]